MSISIIIIIIIIIIICPSSPSSPPPFSPLLFRLSLIAIDPDRHLQKTGALCSPFHHLLLEPTITIHTFRPPPFAPQNMLDIS